MFDLIHASIGIRKAAALKGTRSGEVEFISGPGAGNTEIGIVAYVHNRQGGSISISGGDVEEATKYTWQEINSM